jgi:hypothetical protein
MTTENKSKVLKTVRKKTIKNASFSKSFKDKYEVTVNNRKGKIVVKNKN